MDYYSGGLHGFTHTTQTMLPSLVHVGLYNAYGEQPMKDIGQILHCFNIPNLHSITIAPLGSHSGLLPLLERTIPNAQNISVLNYCPRDWSLSNDQLKCLGMEPTIFAHLTELHLLYEMGRMYYEPYYDQMHSRLGKVIRDLVHFRKGSIIHLTIPPFDDDIIEFMRGHVPYLKVSPPVARRGLLGSYGC